MDVDGVVLDRTSTATTTTTSTTSTADLRVPVASGAVGTSDRPTGGGLVVGVDGSLGVLAAVSWAASEAALRGVALHLVHVGSRPGAGGSGRPVPDPGRVALERARRTAAAVAPHVPTTSARVAGGSVGPALSDVAPHAALLVVGGRRRHDDAGAAGDATIPHLLDRAGCPVVAVPPSRTGAWASTPSSRPVLVTLTGSADDEPALDVALEAARRRRVGLVVAVTDEPGRADAIAAARVRGVQRIEPVADLADLRRLAPPAQLLVVSGPSPTTPPPDAVAPGGLAELLRRGPCPVLVTRAAAGTRRPR